MNQQSVFWQIHESQLGGGARYSDDFKDLMSQMFAYQPFMRPNLVEVQMHSFFTQGAPMATKEEVIAGMTARKQMAEQKKAMTNKELW